MTFVGYGTRWYAVIDTDDDSDDEGEVYAIMENWL